MDLFRPKGANTIRPPTSDEQKNGRIYNTPRFAHLGGLSSARKTGPKNAMTVKKPGDGTKVI